MFLIFFVVECFLTFLLAGMLYFRYFYLQFLDIFFACVPSSFNAAKTEPGQRQRRHTPLLRMSLPGFREEAKSWDSDTSVVGYWF